MLKYINGILQLNGLIILRKESIISGDILGNLDWSGSNGNTTRIRAVATETNSISSSGGKLEFYTTPNGSLIGQKTLELGQDKTIKISNSYTLPNTDGTQGQVLQTNGSGNTSWNTISSNYGNILYVSPNGSDVNLNRSAHIGDINKPFLTLTAAKNAAIIGDLIYVFPQTFVFDNRASNSLFWNNKVEDINLWKNGVTYYFETGCKIKLYNQTGTGNSLYIFNPNGGVTYQTCTVLGKLVVELYSEGVGGGGTLGGISAFFRAGISSLPLNDTYSDVGFNFYCEMSSLITYCNDIININRKVISSNISEKTIININVDYMYLDYIQGQSGAFLGNVIIGSDAYMDVLISAKYVINKHFGLFTLRTITDKTNFLFISESCTCFLRFIDARSCTGIINTDVKKLYIDGSTTQFTIGSTTGAVFNQNNTFINDTNPSGISSVTFNHKGDIFDISPTVSTQALFSSVHPVSINFNGNITTNTTSGLGRLIVSFTTNISKFNMTGDINYYGIGVTTNPTFQSNGASIINYSGKISGNFACPIAQCYAGTININNSNIVSTIDGGNSSILVNSTSNLGTVRINNSYIELKNSTNPISNGSYVKALINNSIIINTGSNAALSNLTSFGFLQLINSTILSTGNSINYTTSNVICANASTNNNIVATNITGTITKITDLVI